MVVLIIVIPILLVVLGLASIRPYCLRHKQGYTPGASIWTASWIDWQHAVEIARKAGDRRMMVVCRVFLFLEIALVILFVVLPFVSP